MGLRERLLMIVNADIPYIGDAWEAPAFVGREVLVQHMLKAVCAETGHDWPYRPAGMSGDGIPLWEINGPCKRCGEKMEAK